MDVINNKIGVIRATFNEKRDLEYIEEYIKDGEPLDLQGGDLFETPKKELVYLSLQLEDFTPEELTRYTELAENLYSLNNKFVTIYILCPENVQVKVREMEIKSFADFTIKLACCDFNPCHMILDIIKEKIDKGEYLDSEDKHVLFMLPMMCDDSERNYFRTECFKLLTEV